MPGKFVTRAAERAGVSLETAEHKWAEAKKAVKKGKRRGSWYWGKVMNTFKRMMGLMETVSFKDFMLLEDEEEDNEFEFEMIRLALTSKGFVEEEVSPVFISADFTKGEWGYDLGIDDNLLGTWYILIRSIDERNYDVEKHGLTPEQLLEICYRWDRKKNAIDKQVTQ